MKNRIAALAEWLKACPLVEATPHTSDFALLDVKTGRKRLASRLISGEPIGVVIIGTLDNARGSIGRDDGVSREFSVVVEHLFIVPK